MGDPEKTVDAAAAELAKVAAEQKSRKQAFKQEYALADMEAKTTILKYPIPVSTGVASFEKPKKSKANGDAKKEALDEALVNEILEEAAEQQTEGNGSTGPNFTFKDVEEPKAKAGDEKPKGEEALKAEAPVATSDLGPEEEKRRRLIRWLKLREINHKYAVIRSYDGKCVVVTTGRSPINPNKKVFLIQSREAFEQWMANEFIPSLEKKNKSDAVGPWWWRHPKRRQFDGVVFEPLAPDVVKTSDGHQLFNTYLGWGVEPKQGDWSLMRRHIKEVLANGDPKTEEYIIRWTAWGIQHPDKPPLVALVLIGRKGRGKGTFARALERIVGDHALQISSQRHIVGNFNAHLENLILMISDEAYWAGHKADAGCLRMMARLSVGQRLPAGSMLE